MLNAFAWAPPERKGDGAIDTLAELAPCPWNPEHRLARIVMKARELGPMRPPIDVVFLIDGSESMAADWKLPLLKKALKQSTALLGKRDQIAIVGGGHYLPPTSGADRISILNAIDRLEAGGLARGPMSIAMAYECAAANFTRGDITRVILISDGDWNHSLADRAAAEKLVEQHAREGVGLSIVELAPPNLGDPAMRKLARRGGGTWACADDLPEARRALAEQLGGGLIQVAAMCRRRSSSTPTRSIPIGSSDASRIPRPAARTLPPPPAPPIWGPDGKCARCTKLFRRGRRVSPTIERSSRSRSNISNHRSR